MVNIEINKSPALPQSEQPPFQSQQSFVQRLISITVQLAQHTGTPQPSTFPNGSNTVELSGSRTTVRIENNGAPTGSMANVSIFGLTQDLLNQLSTLGQIYNLVQGNQITIKAGDAYSAMTTVFTGTIIFAYPDYNSAPNVPMVFVCQGISLINSVVTAKASSFPGPSVDVATVMAGFAQQMGVGFENNGITTQLSPSYFPGNLWSQVQKCAADANIRADLVNGGTVLAIWPSGGSRTSQAGSVPLISKDTGMDGYPSFAPNGLMIVRFLFNPNVSFGATIQVQSVIPSANRTFVVWKLDLALDSLMPNGQWLATAQCYPLGFSAPNPT